jgi:hypothetical protein
MAASFRKWARRFLRLEKRVEAIEARKPQPAPVGHLLAVGGEIKSRPGELFSQTLGRHLDFERGHSSWWAQPREKRRTTDERS